MNLIKNIFSYFPLISIFIVVILLVAVFVLTKIKKEKFLKLIPLAIFFMVLVNGISYAKYINIWSPIDEGSHFSYVEFMVKNKRLPTLSDYVSEEELAIAEYKYPGKPSVKAENIGLWGHVYEAFQPPVYYILSLPVYKIAGGNYYDKIFFLRSWGALQLAIFSVIVYYSILNLKKIFYETTEYAAILATILVGVTPSMVTRSVVIGNAVLPIIFFSLAVFWLTKKYKDEKPLEAKDALILGIITGLALLSRFTMLYMIPIFMGVFVLNWKNLLKNLVIYIIATLLVISPWFGFNLKVYGTLTSNEQARQSQMYVVNPDNLTYGWKYIKDEWMNFEAQVWLPQEAKLNVIGLSSIKMISIFRMINIISYIGILIMSFYLLIDIYRKKYMNFYHNLLIFAVAFGSIFTLVVQLVGGTILSNWPILLGRYLHPVIFLIAFFFVFALSQIRYAKKEILTLVVFIFFSFLILLPNLEYLTVLSPAKYFRSYSIINKIPGIELLTSGNKK